RLCHSVGGEMRRAISFAIVALIVVAVTRAQIPSPTTGRAQATGLAPGWEEIDARLDFLTVRLASVEASLGAVKKAMKQAQASRSQKNNEMMDWNGAEPVP